jgi:hypothetical protein
MSENNDKTIDERTEKEEDEDEEEDNEEDEEDKEEDIIEEDEIDDDYRNLFAESYNRNINRLEEDNSFNKLNNKVRIEKVKVLKHTSFSLSDFYKSANKEEETAKPKKFVSKRVSDKKKSDNSEVKPEYVEKRKFNPRLPPYNLVKKKNNNEIKRLDDDFPSLSKSSF